MPSVLPRETPFNRVASSHEEFIARLNSVEEIVNSDNLLLNEDLGATKKGGFHWIVRVIMNRLGHLFCRDLLSDVRINRVAQKLEEYLRINQQHFTSTDSSREVKAISDRIIAQLNKRTHNRYNAVLDRVLKHPNDQLAGAERSAADAARQAAWATELNGLRDTVARVENQQSGSLQELRNLRAGLQTDLNKLRREFVERGQTVNRNQNPQNGDLQGLRKEQVGLRAELHRLEENIEKLKGEAEVRNQGSQNGDLQGLQKQQDALQTELDKLGKGPEELKKTQQELASLDNDFLSLVDIVHDIRNSVKNIEVKINSEPFNEAKGKASILFNEDESLLFEGDESDEPDASSIFYDGIDVKLSTAVDVMNKAITPTLERTGGGHPLMQPPTTPEDDKS